MVEVGIDLKDVDRFSVAPLLAIFVLFRLVAVWAKDSVRFTDTPFSGLVIA